MSDPVMKSPVRTWFRLVAFFSLTAFTGIVVLMWTEVSAGAFTVSAYICVALSGALLLMLLVWLRGQTDKAPEQIESFLRRLGLFRPET